MKPDPLALNPAEPIVVEFDGGLELEFPAGTPQDVITDASRRFQAEKVVKPQLSGGWLPGGVQGAGPVTAAGAATDLDLAMQGITPAPPEGLTIGDPMPWLGRIAQEPSNQLGDFLSDPGAYIQKIGEIASGPSYGLLGATSGADPMAHSAPDSMLAQALERGTAQAASFAPSAAASLIDAISTRGMPGETAPPPQIAQDLAAQGQAMSEYAQALPSTGPRRLGEIDNPDEMMGYLVNTFGDQAPIIGSLMLPGAAIRGPAAILAGGVGIETGAITQEQQQKYGEFSGPEALAGGAVTGALEALPIMHWLKRTRMGDDAMRWVGDRVLATVEQGAGEASTEYLQSIGEALAVEFTAANRDNFTGKEWETALKVIKERSPQALEEAVAGGVMGTAMGPFGGSSPIDPQAQLRKIFDLKEKAANVEKEMGSKPLPNITLDDIIRNVNQQLRQVEEQTRGKTAEEYFQSQQLETLPPEQMAELTEPDVTPQPDEANVEITRQPPRKEDLDKIGAGIQNEDLLNAKRENAPFWLKRHPKHLEKWVRSVEGYTNETTPKIMYGEMDPVAEATMTRELEQGSQLAEKPQAEKAPQEAPGQPEATEAPTAQAPAQEQEAPPKVQPEAQEEAAPPVEQQEKPKARPLPPVITPPGERWHGDRGASPGSPEFYLDVEDTPDGPDLMTSTAAITRVEDDQGNQEWLATTPGDDVIVQGPELDEVRRRAEDAVDNKKVTKSNQETDLLDSIQSMDDIDDLKSFRDSWEKKPGRWTTRVQKAFDEQWKKSRGQAPTIMELEEMLEDDTTTDEVNETVARVRSETGIDDLTGSERKALEDVIEAKLSQVGVDEAKVGDRVVYTDSSGNERDGFVYRHENGDIVISKLGTRLRESIPKERVRIYRKPEGAGSLFEEKKAKPTETPREKFERLLRTQGFAETPGKHSFKIIGDDEAGYGYEETFEGSRSTKGGARPKWSLETAIRKVLDTAYFEEEPAADVPEEDATGIRVDSVGNRSEEPPNLGPIIIKNLRGETVDTIPVEEAPKPKTKAAELVEKVKGAKEKTTPPVTEPPAEPKLEVREDDEFQGSSPEAPDERRAGAQEGARGGGRAESVREAEGEGDGRDDGATDRGGDATTRGVARSDDDAPRSRKRSERSDDQPVAAGDKPQNFRLTADDVGSGGRMAKIRANLAAIRTMKALEEDGRSPTAEEQAVLAKYVGWGQFPGMFSWTWEERQKMSAAMKAEFQSTDREMYKLQDELSSLLTTEEFESARRSTLNAHYTAPEIVSGMWEMMDRLGFRSGRVLEPSAGVGNFFGLMPEKMRGSKTFGVELDPVTARIAKLLYPQTDITIGGFQDFQFPDSFFDLAISNVPFGSYKVFDKRYNSRNANIHDYFFLKSLDKVRPGGLVAFITSRFTMDKKDSSIRDAMAEKADLVAAIRLPGKAFLKYAGTEVVTDIVILKRREDGEAASGPAWSKTATIPDPLGGEDIAINEYFASSPDQVLGHHDRSGTMYRGGEVNVVRPDNFDEQFQAAIQRLPKDVYERRTKAAGKAFDPNTIIGGERIKQGAFTLRDGKLYIRNGEELEAAEGLTKQEVAVVTGLIGLRDQVREVFSVQIKNAPDAELKAAQKKLNTLYDAFVKKHGALHKRSNVSVFSGDPDAPTVLAIEKWDAEKKKATKSDIFTKRTISSFEVKEEASSLEGAVAVSLIGRGGIDPDYIAGLLAREVESVERDLVKAKLAFLDPSGGWVSSTDYLSGTVRQKLRDAQAAAKADPRFKPNVDALEKVQPEDVVHYDIRARIGSPWIPTSDYLDFLAYLSGDENHWAKKNIRLSRVPGSGQWMIDFPKDAASIARNLDAKYGTNKIGFRALFEKVLNDSKIQVFKDKVLDHEATAAVQLTADSLREQFETWLWQDQDRRSRLHRYYNDNFNNVVIPKFNADHYKNEAGQYTLPGMNPAHALREHQAQAVWRVVSQGKALLAHEVGTGKTFTMIAAAMELRRLGLARKPAIVVPKSIIEQFTADVEKLYPAARVISTSDKFDAKKRKETISQIATGEFDLVLMTHDNLNMLPVAQEVLEAFIKEQLNELTLALSMAEEAEGKKSRFVKRLEKRKESLKNALKEALEESKRDDAVNFDETGIDFILVDEAHFYKNIPVHSARNMKGIPTSQSNRASNMLMITRRLQDRNKGRGVVYATGTPITNTMAENFNLLRVLEGNGLKDRNVELFDAWATVFAEPDVDIERTPSGDYKMVERLAKFVNLPELQGMSGLVFDTVFADDVGEIHRPKRNDRVVEIEMSDAQNDYLSEIARRADELKGGDVDPRIDNYLKLTTDAKKMSTDIRLVVDPKTIPGSFDPTETKVARAVENVVKVLEAGKKAGEKTVQLIFCDQGIHPNEWGFTIYDEALRLLKEAGVPAEKIIDFRKVSKNKKLKQTAIKRLYDGDAWVAIGSSETLGVGINAQQYLKAVHHLDIDWRPDKKEQRDGRIWRSGNTHKEVDLFYYLTIGSFDMQMWQMNARKAKFIRDYMKGRRSGEREMAEDDGDVLGYADIMAIASGDPTLLQRVKLQDQVAKLNRKRRGYEHQAADRERNRARAESTATHWQKTAEEREKLEAFVKGDPERITVGETTHDLSEEGGTKTAGEALIEALTKAPENAPPRRVGEYRGLGIYITKEKKHRFSEIKTETFMSYESLIDVARLDFRATSETGAIASLKYAVDALPGSIASSKQKAAEAAADAEMAAKEIAKAGKNPYEEKYAAAKEKLANLTRSMVSDEKAGAPPAGDDSFTDQTTELHSFTDPLSGLIAKLAEYASKPFMARKPSTAELFIPPALRDNPPEVVQSISDRKAAARLGAKDREMADSAKKAASGIRQSFTSSFEYLNEKNSIDHALFVDILRQYRAAPQFARSVAYDSIKNITEGLSPEMLAVFTDYLALGDIIKDVENGLYEGREELPFGYWHPSLGEENRTFRNEAGKTVERPDITTEYEAVSAIAAANSPIKKALEMRQKFQEQLTRKLVNLGILKPEVLDDKRYYHRQVLEYLNAREQKWIGAGGGPDAHVRKKTFQMRRAGGSDFSLAYYEAEFEYIAQAVSQVVKIETLNRLKDLADISGQLAELAKARNLSAFYSAYADSIGVDLFELQEMIQAKPKDADPLWPYRMRIARAFSNLSKLAAQGDLPHLGHQDVVEALEEAHWASKDAQEVSDDPTEFSGVDHPALFKYLAALGAQDGDLSGTKWALSIFKAIREREAEIKSTLGSKYLTWRKLSADRDGYTTWQPREGFHFFKATTIPERILDQVLAGERALKDDDLRDVMARGTPLETWVIPKELAATLDEWGSTGRGEAPDIAHQWLISSWKQWVLLNPLRALRYNVNNMSGDLDIIIAYDPKILAHAGQAGRDLWEYHFGRKTTKKLAEEIEEAIKLGVVDNGLTTLEIPDIKNTGAFQLLVSKDARPNRVQKTVETYWRGVRGMTVWRENLLRLAAYRYFQQKVKEGGKVYGASKPKSIDAIKDPTEKAAKLARELIGDYGNISQAGQWLRRNMIPFYSWIEINAPRYARLLKNAPKEGLGGSPRARAVAALGAGSVFRGGLKVGAFAIKAHILFGLVNMWNRIFFPDEDREVNKNRGQLHLILGRSPDGTIISVRFEGALADALEWFDLDDYPQDIANLLAGKKDLADMGAEAIKAPINRVLQSWEPISKTTFEIVLGKSSFPDLFETGKSFRLRARPIRNRLEHLGRTVSMDWLVRTVSRLGDKPSPKRPSSELFPGDPGIGKLLNATLLYRTDSGEASYWYAKHLGYEWKKKMGLDSGGSFSPSDRSNALYYYRKAVMWGDEKAAAAWLKEYGKLGGTAGGLSRSINMAHPLGMMSKKQVAPFLASLSEVDRAEVDEAIMWYGKVYGGGRDDTN